MTLLEWVKADMNAGHFKEWGACCDSNSGYCIVDGDEVSLQSQILKYEPFIIFDIKSVLSADQTIEAIQRAVAAAKGR